jgi:peroxiredoxin
VKHATAKDSTATKPTKPSKRRRALSIGLQVVLVLLALVAITEWQARGLIPRRSAAPDFTLRALDGSEVSISQARGKTVVLYFFAPWCSVCNLASKNVVALRNARSEAEVAIYAVGLDWGSPDELARFARDHELNVPVLAGGDDVRREYAIQAYPTVYVLDGRGRVRDRVVGYTTELGLLLRSL